ncbi:PREDICTED: uncharacterized protein LOC105972918 [Erythranthe guttata]|uniref:uncharacterized protein LOC105972918 n=1 Tax=Erythranthe guttata TaxID=4155 RepID=UPI00064DAE58|nr:PREDICTED: uncharacterized protein LOC105972918 [Erythranthe guttata]XP_012853351.1 PREDICTED: uncharacterized protein LOC105972918 [Erythranthe guttata]|eukprot:XP_012853350.1 PREDICTED: uncharacterized protein LOC105972918 [Erythranthe guttata]
MSAPSSPETICLQCGDRGFDNAFVYCVKCLEVAVHRYCLDVIPKTTDEFVRWVCEDCDVEFQNPPVVGKHDSGQCHSVDRTSDHIIGQSEVGTTDVAFQNPPAVVKHDSGQCHSVDRTSDCIIGQSEVGTTENDSVAVNTHTLPMELDILYSASERKPM